MQIVLPEVLRRKNAAKMIQSLYRLLRNERGDCPKTDMI